MPNGPVGFQAVHAADLDLPTVEVAADGSCGPRMSCRIGTRTNTVVTRLCRNR